MGFIVFKQSGLRWLWLTLLMLVADQLTKYWVVSHFTLYESVAVMPFFNFTYMQNTGAAFSFLADAGGWQRWFFTAIAIIVTTVLLVWMKKTPREQKLLPIAFALVISGALGNVIDRLQFGYVVDFLDFYLGSYHWPAFNIADAAIFIGAALILYDGFTSKEA
jgi:signal peptidase II